MSKFKRIKKYRRTVSRLTNAQATEYFHLNMVRLPVWVAKAPVLAGRWAAFVADYGRLDSCFKFPPYAPETEEVKEAENLREMDFRLFANTVDNLVRYCTDPDLLPSVKVIKDILAPHRGADRQEYQSETAAIDDLVKKLELAENMPHVVKLGLDKVLALLKAHNLLFQERYAKRFDNRYAQKEEGTTTQAKLKALESFDLFCEAVTGLQLVATDPDIIEALDEIATLINAVTDQYTIILNRHLHIKGSTGGSEDGEDEDDGFIDPDTDNPSPFTPPDITNPPAPFE